jgi:hypothetical protein
MRSTLRNGAAISPEIASPSRLDTTMAEKDENCAGQSK